VQLDSRLGAPLFRQLYAGIRDAVLGGRLPAGSRLPPSRGLAAELGVSRNTVLLAYDQLGAEGYVEAEPRSGVRVAGAVTLPPPRRPAVSAPDPRPASPRLSSRGSAIARAGLPGSSGREPAPRPFRPGTPALELFPARIWGRLWNRRLKDPPSLGYADPAGFPPLRAALAEYVGAARGVRCTEDQVIVVGGSQQALDLAARVLLDPGDEVWLEDPGYRGARAAMLAAGARLVPVPVDGDGLRVDRGRALAPRSRLACVSPSHQFPLGATMSAGRRLDLLSWASSAGAWVLEDDYDSEFRYRARPLASLQSMDAEGRVIYVGTFSKTLLPALRLGYVVVPPDVVEAFRIARAICDRHAPVLDQAVLADFLAQGHFARHVRRMRACYAERQEAMLRAFGHWLGGRIEVRPAEAGMHLVGWLAPGEDDQAVSARLLEAGVEAPALSRYALVRPERGGLLLGWAGYSPAAIEDAARRMAAALS
jgi:GntR family transcriptional regulator/MocR family aminotransferase